MRKVAMLLKTAEQRGRVFKHTSLNCKHIWQMNRVSLETNERDFVLKVVSLENCEILVESIKARRHDDDKKNQTAWPKGALRNSSKHYWEDIVHFLRSVAVSVLGREKAFMAPNQSKSLLHNL